MPIAITGIGCRFPGGIVDTESFWRVVAGGVDAITEIPADRFDIARYYDPTPGTRGKIMTRRGGFVEQRLEDFDADFFGISRTYAERLDPQQRLLLETAWEAMEDAGVDIVGVQGSPTGVFIGQWVSDFEHRLFADPDGIDFAMAMGSGRYAAAGRLSYAFGFRGPSLSIDAACSSGLAAVHLAVRSLRSGDSAIALAGGVNMILQPHIHLAYSYSKMMAPDGRCRFGDESGSGYVRAEGAGIVVLKPLADAMADGDRVYAVIRGSAVNNDGSSSGVMGRPSRIGQEELIRQALRDGGVAAAELDYVEAHGTGTLAGDPVELSALGAVLSDGRAPDAPRTMVGSVKTNFGHTEAAAGVAGLIKTALALQHAQIPPSLHFVTPNPTVPWSSLPLEIATALTPWPMRDGPRYAGVSSYGIGGTNAHVVLESAPQPDGAALRTPHTADPLLLPLSARSRAALRALAARYAALLSAPDCDAPVVCFSAATRRSALPYRAAFVADDRSALCAAVRAYADGDAPTADGIVHDSARRRVAFVVPGQGAQWAGMARRFFAQNATFREALQACDAAARAVVPWSIIEQLHLDASADTWLGDRIDVIQPTLVAMAIAYAAWLRSIGVMPDAVVGHSLGEVGAAAIAGVIDTATAMRIICRRSALMLRTSGQGAMAVIDMSQSDVEARLRASGSPVSVSVSNSVRSTVVSGAPADVHALLAQLDAEGVYARLVNVDVASHGPQMESLVPELVSALADVRPAACTMPIYSTVLAARTDGETFDAGYWGRNLRETVQFARTVDIMIADGISAFIELGPHAVLTYAIAQTAEAAGRDVLVAACGKRETDDLQAAARVVGALWANGAAVDWRAVMPWGRTVTTLPSYPWQRERFWYDTTAGARKTTRLARGTALHPFLGARIETAADNGGVEWDVQFSATEAPWLADHVVRGSAIVPAAAMIDVMAAAVRETLGPGRDVMLRQVSVSEAIPLQDESLAVRLVTTRPSADQLQLQLRVRDDAGWHAVATAIGSLAGEAGTPALVANDSNRVGDSLDGAMHYRGMARRALAYGPAFQVVQAMSARDGVATATLATAQRDDAAGRVTLLDGALQAVLSLATSTFASAHETIVPVRVREVVLRFAPWAATLTVSAARTDTSDAGVLSGDARLVDGTGVECAVLSGVDMQVMRAPVREELSSMRYRIAWTPVAPATEPASRAHWLFVLDEGGAGARAAARLRAAGHEVHEWLARDVAAGLAIPEGTDRIVICTPLDATQEAPRGTALDAALRDAYDTPLAVIQRATNAAVPPTSVVVVTHGAVAVHADADVTAPLQGAAWGLLRVARHEHPSLGCAILDLDPATLSDALLAGAPTSAECELARRDGQWFASRVEAVTGADRAEPSASAGAAADYVADVATPGLLESLGWRAQAARSPAAHEVEIAVAATGINFLDVLGALDAFQLTADAAGAPRLGLECSGTVTRIGRDVTHVAVGDRVLAVHEGSLANRVTAHGALVVKLPEHVDSLEASGFPLAFLTVARALEDVARLRAGERILIHSAAGGVGLAALQIARNLGAEIFATAGTAEKRAMLREMGVAHVFDSRTLAWGDEVLAATGGAGVDVILNSLAGAAIETGFRVLSMYGRFIEIGKRDLFNGSRFGMAVFQKQAVVTAVNLLDQIRLDAPSLGVLLRDLVDRLGRGELTLLPTTRWTAEQVSEAFRSLLPGTHVGKVVITFDDAPRDIRPAADSLTVRGRATYLLTGGLGTLGLRAAKQLVLRGAQHLVLVGRSAPRDAALVAITGWRAAGVMVDAVAGDIAHPDTTATLRKLLATRPPLGGVLHAAGVLDDGLLAAQTPARMRDVASAKVGGLFQIVSLPGIAQADFVVLYSSIASALGTSGQANYAAANAVLDATAHALRARGVRATSIGFGPFAGAGLATDGRGLEILGDSGFGALRPTHADVAIDVLAGSARVHEIVASFDAAAWVQMHADPAERRRMSALLTPEAGDATTAVVEGLRDGLARIVGSRQREDFVMAFVQQEVAGVLRSTPDRVEPMKALRTMGIDSLTALELKNRLERASSLRLPGTLVFTYPTAAAIAAHILERLAPITAASDAPSVAASPVPTADDALDALARDMAAMDDETLRRLLLEHGMGDA